VTDHSPRIVLIAGALFLVPFLAYAAYSRPALFSSPNLLAGLIGLELLFAAVWMYRRVFFTLIVIAFVFAGADLPLGGVWTSGRWMFLIAGAAVGCFIVLKERRSRFGVFHVLAIFAVLSAMVSAAVSRYPGLAFLKALSLLLLLVYAGTGARLAASGRESRFLSGLLLGSEIFIGGLAAFYYMGRDVMGNPNSLGAVTAVIAPVLLWGTFLDDRPVVRHRRFFLFAICCYMLIHSQSRAGLIAGFLSCAVLCLSLRKYKLFAQGVVIILILIATTAIFEPEKFSATVSAMTSSVVYKDKDPTRGVFASREAPWHAAVDGIRKHLWFGSGFGTTDTGQDASAQLSMYTSTTASTFEYGSSYLAITAWVGLLGVLPFLLIVFAILLKVVRTVLWMLNTNSPLHPAVPIAMIVLTGLIHAVFEDWLFAPGYYLCVFFWCLAFVLVDVAPWAPLPSFTMSWRPWLMRQSMGRIAMSR
jgi:O-antigen ligase